MNEGVSVIVYGADGRIQYVSHVPAHLAALQASDGLLWMLGEANPSVHYVLNSEVTLRPENPVRLDQQTLRDLPVPATIRIGSAVYEVNESVVELEMTYPGDYFIQVLAFPYRDVILKVTV